MKEPIGTHALNTENRYLCFLIYFLDHFTYFFLDER